MDVKTQQDIDFYESEQIDKKRKEEFYKSAFTVPEQPTFIIPEETISLTKEELREARIRFYNKNYGLSKKN
jgi:hypothetical protein